MKRLIPSSAAVLTAFSMVACGGADAPSQYPAQHAPHDSPAMEAEATAGDGVQPGAYPQPSPAPPHAGGMAQRDRAPSADDPFGVERQQNRPGLATSWGETRHSRVSSAPFMRASNTSPFAVGKVFYNDPDGIAAMSDSNPGWRQNTRAFAVGSGHVEMGLRDGSGNFLTGFEANGDNFVTGVSGRRYTIVVKNQSPGRIEAVVSVDGLDVIDGKAASTKKRGYLLDPFGELEVEGFRTSNSEVAAFRFGSVQQSYANKKHGETRNVGVIGIAVFHEQGDNPNAWGTPGDSRTRKGANPFPNTYASPP